VNNLIKGAVLSDVKYSYTIESIANWVKSDVSKQLYRNAAKDIKSQKD